MTLIATFKAGNSRVLIGDLMMSADESWGSTHEMWLPTRGIVKGLNGAAPKRVLVGLLQKVVLVHRKCALAWCGKPEIAKRVIDHLKVMIAEEEQEEGGFPIAVVDRFVDTYTELLTEQETGIILMFVEGATLRLGFCNVHEWESANSGLVDCGGSGYPIFRELIDGIFADFPKTGHGMVDALMMTYSLAGHLLRQEATVEKTLESWFGGGYEIAYFDAETMSFAKYDNITFVFWEAGINDKGIGLKKPRLFLKQFYDGNVLITQSIRMLRRGEENSSNIYTAPNVQAVYPLEGGAYDFGGFELRPMESNTMVHVIDTYDEKGMQRVILVDVIPKGNEIPMKIRIVEDGFSLDIPGPYSTEIFERLRANLSEARKYDHLRGTGPRNG